MSEPSTVSILWEAIRDAPARVLFEALLFAVAFVAPVVVVGPRLLDQALMLYESGLYVAFAFTVLGAMTVWHWMGKLLLDL